MADRCSTHRQGEAGIPGPHDAVPHAQASTASGPSHAARLAPRFCSLSSLRVQLTTVPGYSLPTTMSSIFRVTLRRCWRTPPGPPVLLARTVRGSWRRRWPTRRPPARPARPRPRSRPPRTGWAGQPPPPPQWRSPGWSGGPWQGRRGGCGVMERGGGRGVREKGESRKVVARLLRYRVQELAARHASLLHSSPLPLHNSPAGQGPVGRGGARGLSVRKEECECFCSTKKGSGMRR